MRNLPTMISMTRTTARAGAAVATLALVAACNADRLSIPNPNQVTPEAISSDPLTAIPLAANGIVRSLRATHGGMVSDFGIFGRESYIYTPTENRNTSHYLGQNPLDRTGFAAGAGQWSARYTNRINVKNFLTSVEGATGLTATQKAASRGFAKTIDAMELMYIIFARHNNGAVIQMNEDPRELAPFVTRDAVYAEVSRLLDEAKTDLAAGGTAFPFSLHSGFAGFNTPATFLQFNRAIAARVFAHRAALGGGAAMWTAAQTALGESFLNDAPANAAALARGVYHVYSTSPGDVPTSLFSAPGTGTTVAHSSIKTAFESRADGSPDLRYAAKVRGRPSIAPTGANVGIATDVEFAFIPDQNTPLPIIRNEELILLRAEARLGLGNKAGALADINTIRTVSGGVGPSALTAASSNDAFITEILNQRRLSLLFEGHRWIDVRRYGRLNDLPLDLPSHFRQMQQPIPQAECLIRSGSGSPPPSC